MFVLILLVVLALIFGVGGVIKGLAWAFLITIVLIAVAGYLGFRKLSSKGD